MEAKPTTRDVWSKPIQATISVPLDTFKVEIEDGIELQIRLETNGDVSLFISAFNHPSYLKTTTMPFPDFAEAIGRAFFGPNWRKST